MICLELFAMFFKIGLFTFGGGYAMLPLIQEEIASRGWLSEAELVNFVAVSESTPGPFAVNVSTYVGLETGGVLGAVFATLGVIMPSFIVILLVARCFTRFRQSRLVRGCMSGLRPAAVGLIGAAALSVGKTALFPTGGGGIESLAAVLIFAVSMALTAKNIHPIIVIALSAMLGIAAGLALGI